MNISSKFGNDTRSKSNEDIKTIDKEYWIIITWLSLILLCVLFLNIEKLYRMPMCRNICYSNTIKIMIFFSDIKSNYVKHQVVYIYLS